jgi:hypothetical protein
MSLEKTDIKNQRPGIMLTPGLPPIAAVTSEPAEDGASEQDRALSKA